MTVGNWHEGIGYNTPRYFDGLIDELRIYNRELSNSEILLLCELEPIITKSKQINIFPNPSDGIIHSITECIDLENTTYKLFDIGGRLIKNGKFTRTLSLLENNAGSYILQVYELEELLFTEIIVILY